MMPASSRRSAQCPEPNVEGAEAAEAAEATEATEAAEAAEAEESLHQMAARLHPEVDWSRMSEEAVRQALGLPVQCCQQRRDYEAGRQAAAAGEVPGPEASMAFRLGWSHGRPPRARRRRWRSRPAAGQGPQGR